MFSNRAKRLGVRCDQCFLCGMDRILCGLALASISFVTRPLLTFLMTVAQRHEDAKLSVDAVYIKSCTHFLSPCKPGMDSLPITISRPPWRGYCHEDRLRVWITTDPGSGEVSYDTETMGPRSLLAAQVTAQNVPGCIQSITVCNTVTTMSALMAVRSSEYDCEQKPVSATCWLGPHPGMGWVKLDGDWSWCQCQGMQSRTLRHTGQSAANQRPVCWAADQ